MSAPKVLLFVIYDIVYRTAPATPGLLNTVYIVQWSGAVHCSPNVNSRLLWTVLTECEGPGSGVL